MGRGCGGQTPSWRSPRIRPRIPMDGSYLATGPVEPRAAARRLPCFVRSIARGVVSQLHDRSRPWRRRQARQQPPIVRHHLRAAQLGQRQIEAVGTRDVPTCWLLRARGRRVVPRARVRRADQATPPPSPLPAPRRFRPGAASTRQRCRPLGQSGPVPVASGFQPPAPRPRRCQIPQRTICRRRSHRRRASPRIAILADQVRAIGLLDIRRRQAANALRQCKPLCRREPRG